MVRQPANRTWKETPEQARGEACEFRSSLIPQSPDEAHFRLFEGRASGDLERKHRSVLVQDRECRPRVYRSVLPFRYERSRDCRTAGPSLRISFVSRPG